jgi:hypothetical protein
MRGTAVTGMPRWIARSGGVDARAPHANAVNVALERCRDLGRGSLAPQQPEQVRRRAAAQPCVCAAREDRGEVLSLDARRAVACAVDAAMLAQKRAGADSMADLVRRHAGIEQLSARDDAVLRRREMPDDSFNRGRLKGHQPL